MPAWRALTDKRVGQVKSVNRWVVVNLSPYSRIIRIVNNYSLANRAFPLACVVLLLSILEPKLLSLFYRKVRIQLSYFIFAFWAKGKNSIKVFNSSRKSPLFNCLYKAFVVRSFPRGGGRDPRYQPSIPDPLILQVLLFLYYVTFI